MKPPKHWPKAVEKWIVTKEADWLSHVYVQQLQRRLLGFQEAFPTHISLVTKRDIQQCSARPAGGPGAGKVAGILDE